MLHKLMLVVQLTHLPSFAYGDYNFGDTTDTLTLTVSDAAGNSSTSSITIDITKTDNQAPSISNFTANNTTVTVSTHHNQQALILVLH